MQLLRKVATFTIADYAFLCHYTHDCKDSIQTPKKGLKKCWNILKLIYCVPWLISFFSDRYNWIFWSSRRVYGQIYSGKKI